MVLPSTGQISFTDIQNEFGGTYPIGLDEYYLNASSGYTNGVSGIPNIGSELSLSIFRGKSKPPKTVTLQTGQFSAPGSPGAWLHYESNLVRLPSDYKSTVKWDLKFACIKQYSSYNFAYPYMGIKAQNGTDLAVTAIAGSTYTYHYLERNWNNQSKNLGQANDYIKFFVSFFTYANLTNCNFRLTLTYNPL